MTLSQKCWTEDKNKRSIRTVFDSIRPIFYSKNEYLVFDILFENIRILFGIRTCNFCILFDFESKIFDSIRIRKNEKSYSNNSILFYSILFDPWLVQTIFIRVTML